MGEYDVAGLFFGRAPICIAQVGAFLHLRGNDNNNDNNDNNSISRRELHEVLQRCAETFAALRPTLRHDLLLVIFITTEYGSACRFQTARVVFLKKK